MMKKAIDNIYNLFGFLKKPLLWQGRRLHGSLCLVMLLMLANLNFALSKTLEEGDLDYVMVEVNGQARQVKAGEHFTVVRGDRVKIIDAVLLDAQKRPTHVNFLGFVAKHAANTEDDRGALIDTLEDLLDYWSVDKKGRVYRIKVFSGPVLHGYVYMDIVEPTLRYAEIEVNGKKRLLREREQLTVYDSDQFKLVRVVTNIENDMDTVKFKLRPIPVDEKTLGWLKLYAIEFYRGRQRFAVVPLQIISKAEEKR